MSSVARLLLIMFMRMDMCERDEESLSQASGWPRQPQELEATENTRHGIPIPVSAPGPVRVVRSLSRLCAV